MVKAVKSGDSGGCAIFVLIIEIKSYTLMAKSPIP